MRRSAKSTKPLPKASRHSRVSGPALVTSDEYVGDDWLEDDLPPAKRKRLNKDASYFTSGSRKRSKQNSEHSRRSSRSPHSTHANGVAVADAGDENAAPIDVDADVSSSLVLKLDSDVFSQDEDKDADISADFHRINVTSSPPLTSTQRVHEWTTRAGGRGKRARQVRMPEFGVRLADNGHANGVSASRSGSSCAPSSISNGFISATGAADDVVALPPKPALQLRVRIKDESVIVPVKDPTLTMAWLADEAAVRYHKRHSVKPVLSLRTADGTAMYSRDDRICDLLTDGQTVSKV